MIKTEKSLCFLKVKKIYLKMLSKQIRIYSFYRIERCVYIGQWLASSRVPCHLEAIARRYCRLSVGSPLSSIEWWSNHLRVPLFLSEPVNDGRPSGLPDFHERTNERTGRGKRRRRWRRDDENRAWNATVAFSAGFSLALKEGGTLVKNCRSRGTSREGSRFFRWLGRVTSSSDPRDHCLRSLPPQSASNGCPRSPLERAAAIDRSNLIEESRGGFGGLEDSIIVNSNFENNVRDNFNFKIIWDGYLGRCRAAARVNFK